MLDSSTDKESMIYIPNLFQWSHTSVVAHSSSKLSALGGADFKVYSKLSLVIVYTDIRGRRVGFYVHGFNFITNQEQRAIVAAEWQL